MQAGWQHSVGLGHSEAMAAVSAKTSDQTRQCEGSNAHARTDGRKISAPRFTHSERGIGAAEDALPATNPEATYPRIPSVDEVVNSQYFLQHK